MDEEREATCQVPWELYRKIGLLHGLFKYLPVVPVLDIRNGQYVVSRPILVRFLAHLDKSMDVGRTLHNMVAEELPPYLDRAQEIS